jgi:amino acid adenylation domain-containing protein
MLNQADYVHSGGSVKLIQLDAAHVAQSEISIAVGFSPMTPDDDLAARRARLSASKQALVAQRLRGSAASANATDTIRRLSRGASRPLSFVQQRLWFLQQLEPASWAYNDVMLLNFEGDLDIAALTRAIQEVVRRHEVLRSTYHGAGSELHQIIHELDDMRVDLPVVDLADLPDAERETRTTEHVNQYVRRPFELSAGPLIRTNLIRINPRKFLLVHVAHHIVSDGSSLQLFIQEAAELYRAFSLSRPSPLPELPIQYGDYAHWHREWLTGTLLQQQLQYWKEQLQDAPAVLELPGRRPQLADATGVAVAAKLVIDRELRDLFASLCRQHGATLFMGLLAAFNALLHRYTAAQDIVVGTPVAGRTRPELERLIGFFVNTLALRTRVAGDLTFLELLQRVRATALGAFAHQDVPFDRVVEELQPVRNLSYTPLFQVMFAHENFVKVDEHLPGLRTYRTALEAPAASFALTLAIHESPTELHAVVEGSRDLFEADFVQQLGEHYLNVLRAVATDPATRIADLKLLSPAERRRIVVDWNLPCRGATSRPEALTPVHSGFEAAAARSPHAVAVEHGGAAWTYSELNASVDRLACGLQREGVGSGQRVGVLTDRSIDSIRAMLAIWKAQAVYVPLDPSAPSGRLDQMINDAGLAVVLRPPFEQYEVASGGPAIESHGGLDQPAYIIFTSGSSGRPKGIVVSHRALAQHSADVTREYGLTPADRVLQFSAPIFDTALEQVLPPLLVGACVVLRANEVPDPQQFPFALRDAGITVADLPTAFWRAMGRGVDGPAEPVKCPALRVVIVGGEVMQPEDAMLERCFTWRGRLLNAYGPTEATITSLLYEVPAGFADAVVPIGRPIGGRAAVLVDQYDDPVPPGIVGELCLGGTGLADAYLNRPELTDAAFIPNPFAGELRGDRLYRTGDMGRYRADGLIEFVRRRDEQVKIRGHRVELGEIEAALRDHDAIQQALVVFRDAQLAAYVTRSGHGQPDRAELQTFLRTRLPNYMVPSSYTVLPHLPLSAGGKISKQTLPPPAKHATPAAKRRAPRTQLEAVLSAIWADALGIEEPGRDDDFFALGGHSLLATRIVVEARKAFNVEIPLRWLFERPTIAGFAGRIQGSLLPTRLAQPSPISRTRPIPLAIPQEEFWVADRAMPGAPFFTIATAVRLGGAIDERALARSFSLLVQRHEALRTTFSTVEGRPVQIVHPPAPFTVEVFDLEFFPPSERDAALAYVIEDFSRHRFDLEHGPLVRGGLASLGPTEHVALLAMHHIISDGWSMEIIARELETAYSATVAGAALALPALPIQYADFTVWQTDAVASGALDPQLAYWEKALQGDLQPLSMPHDHPRPAARTCRYSTERLALAPALAQAIETEARRGQATLFMVMLAGFKAVVASLTGQTDIRIGTIAANRNFPALENVVGLFINTLVLRTDLSGKPDFVEVLARVRRVTLDAFEHQDVPFECIRETLRARGPGVFESLFQILFLFDTPRLRLSGMRGVEMLGNAAVPSATEIQFSAFDWIVEVNQEAAGLSVQLKYDVDLYQPATIRSVLKQFEELLVAVTSGKSA